ncbi:zinc-binding dehydrogenase [Ilumatobacter nonamiensis]|uniref:zinc-binding dehydrogenase n=1 Tax=Ilumatobacter nonamiensis TaxID=467093 RepID=UPI000347705C|nr:zinc-binding dehydrogenase [Ilumatobacter nonamiensis]
MRAAALNSGQIYVRDDVPEPQPEVGQILVQVKACGICGSDLHFAQHGADWLALSNEMQGAPPLTLDGPDVDLDRDVFMGHEFSAEVLELGPDTEGPKPGTLVTSIPLLLTAAGMRSITYNNDVPAGYGERMLLSAPVVTEVPNGLDFRHAALTEPMAVGMHAVNKSSITPNEGALVLGCGPVGLAVIGALKLKGVETIVATDFSPARRALAATMGASEVVDPATEPAFDAWQRAGGGRPLVVFEAIGVPGIMDGVLRDAPHGTRLAVVGVCMEHDRINPFFALNKEMNIQFCFAYDPMEFNETLRCIAEGELDVAPLITGEVGLDGVAGAFEALGDPDSHCKVLVTP